MPRTTRRRATEADLTEPQRMIYQQLNDEGKEEFLKQLPLISVSSAANRKKAEQIRERLSLVDGMLAELQNHRRELQQLARELDRGTVAASSVDLRKLLAPPAIEGVSLRYVRGNKG